MSEMDISGVKFIYAKTQLLQEGYTEQEILHASYQAPFDGKENKPAQASHTQKYFEENPELSKEIARQMLKDVEQRELDKTTANVLASQLAPGQHAQAYYTAVASDRLGIPLYKIGLVGVGLVIAAYKIKIPESIIEVAIYVVLALFNLYFLGKYYLERRRVKKIQ